MANIFYELTCEDLTGLGGPMGSERTHEIFRKAFTNLEEAKAFAERDHRKRDRREDIQWIKNGRTEWFSGDLLSHAYTITRRVISSKIVKMRG